MKTIFKVTSQILLHFFKVKRYRSTALLLAVCMMLNMIPNFSLIMAEDNTSSFQAKQADNNGNYAILNWSGTPGSKFAVEKSNNTDDIYETIPLKYSIKVLNVYPNIGNNLKYWMQSNNTGSPTINGTKYTMTVDEVPIYYFNSNPSAYMGTAGNWKYDVIYFGGYDSNNNCDISLLARNSLEQFIKSGGGVLLGHDTASLDFVNFKYIALNYLNLQASSIAETNLPPSSPDYIPAYGNTKVKVARKGLLTNYPYALGDVGTVLTVPESHSYHEFAGGNIWLTYDGSIGQWDTSLPELTNFKGKTGTNNFYLTTLNNVAMIQTGHSGGAATLDEQKILTNTLYYLAQTTNQTTFDDHSAQDLTAPSKVSGPVTVSENRLSFTDSVDAGNNYSYKLYTVNDVSGTKTDTGERAQVTVKTGFKGYSYVINQSPTAINIDTTVETTTADIDVSTLTVGNYYLHIRAVDNAGNASDVSVLAFTIKSTQPTSSVTLNKPVFTNDKSGYYFKSAKINNFTGINSITFSITKGTTVKSVPAFLTPSSKLESIDGDIRTFAYVFDKSVTVSQAEEFIRGIVFNYVPGAELSITVDNNETKLPDGAKITKFDHPDGTEHYYMYVPSNFISWTDAYNKAKSYTYMGLKGYLTTITSKEEDEILTNISTISAWSAGTRYLNADSSKLIDPISINTLIRTSNYYYWACGPEAGTVYYNSILPTLNPGAGYTGYNGAYNNWGANPGQPDAYGGVEVCMQVNWPYDIGASGKMRWNDLPNGGLPNIDLVKGYFVEFSNYAGGVINTYASDKTAVGTFNLIIDGSVEEVATVNLNAPIYGSNKSEFSFANAEVKNINTIYSITIKLNNYTNVMYKPSAPAVSNELCNIAGATNTITYQFNSGISLADAQNFLRGLKYRYGGLKSSSATNVSVTIDGNKTVLPTGASITEFNGHYYMYVNDYLSWTDAYNKAKTYCYMGMTGYLATITSAQEDKVLDNISMNGAWSAGTRYTGVYDTNIAPSGALDRYFKWACGPEAGTNYYYFNSTSDKYSVNGAYNGFIDAGEPNGYYAYGKYECCMQVHYKAELYYSSITWNDLRDIIYNGAYNGYGYEPGVGYFVEFSDYEGGRVDGFMQSANGESTVSIDVTKGDVFSTVKESGTYYVDTLLKAFDRNITRITVNGITFTNGNKLTGNKNTTYTIVATDLEGNTSTMTVNMKTIASISEPIKYLTVNNVQMSNKETILAVRAALQAIDTTDANTNQVIEINNAIQNCNNLYFAVFNATPTAPNGTNGWYKNGIGDIMLTAPDGFKISTSTTGIWTSSITVDNADGVNKTVVYYLKEVSTNEISNEKTFNYKVDTNAPTGTITVKTNQFKTFINNITFGLFYKNSVDVSIVATDTLSTPISISYQKVKGGEFYNENGTWTTGSSFIVRANEKFYVYAKLVDSAGNVVIINSNGVVVYTDSTQGTSNISFTKTSTKDVAATVNLNGNTVKDIKNGISVIDSSKYTVASDGTISFKASYLDSLNVGTYTLTVSYNPMGEIYVPGLSFGDAPALTTLTLVIKAKDMSDNGSTSTANISINPGNTTYNGSAFNPTVVVTDGTKMLVKDVDYTITWPNNMTDVGVKTLTVTFMGDYSGTITKSVNITNAGITDKTNKSQSDVFDNTQKTIVTPTGITVNNQKMTVMYSIDGKTYNLAYAPTFTAAGKYTVYYQLIAPNHNTVTGQIEFIINTATDNTISNLALNNWVFGEKANTPTATVKYDTPIFTYSDSENGIYTDTIPTAAGTYFVKATVNATAEYNKCEATASFAIFSKQVASKDIVISGVKSYYLFTGKEITFEPTVTVNGIVLAKNIDYTVTLENNIEIGKAAKVKVVLIGNYSGSTEIVFEIRYGEISDIDLSNIITMLDVNTKGWYNKDIDINAVGDWSLCDSANGTFGKTLTISTESSIAGSEYTFYIKSSDGSIYERTFTYKLDKTGPIGTISVGGNIWNKFLNVITFGLFFNSTQTVSIDTDKDVSGIEKVEYVESSFPLTIEEVMAITNWSVGHSVNVTLEDAKQFIYYAKLTDNAGNVSYLSTDGFEYDISAPAITGIVNGEIYYTTQLVTINDENISSVSLNGNVISSPFTLAGNIDETYVIVVTDSANNTSTYTVTMKSISSLATEINLITKDNVKATDENIIKNVLLSIDKVDIANATQDEKDALKGITDKCMDLLEIIKDTLEEIKRISDAVKGYDLSNVKSTDLDALEQLVQDIDTLIVSNNLTDDEKTALSNIKTDVNNLIAMISGTAKLIETLTGIIDGYVLNEVKSTDRDAITKIIADIISLEETENLIEEEKAALNELKVRANTLLQRIDDAISASKIADDIKLSDKAELEEAKEAIEAAIEEYERNYTETELSLLNTKLEIVNNALIAISNAEKVIALIIALPEIIKESDKDIIDAAKTAYDSLTDDEKEMVGSEYVNRLNAALKAYDTLEEIKRISDAVKGYDLSSVKSTDLDALEQLIQDIDTLIVSNNLTDDEKTALSNIKTDVNNLIAMISGTAKLIETLTGIIDGYILNEVKSTDRDAITMIIADIISLEQTENLTEEEKAALNELKVRANTLLQRIDDAISASKIADDIKLSDKVELEEAKEAIEAAIEEYEGNYTETELSLLNTKLEIVNNALIAIGNSEKVIALIITLPEIIKESDKDIIDAAKTAYDSLTDDEKEMVGSEYVNRLNAALKAYDNLEEIKRISDAVKGYDLSNVKSTDLDALEQLIQDIDTLIVSNNLTDDKKTALSNIKTDVNNLIAMISVTVKLIETLTGITDGYILNEVKSTDRDAITKIIADIISLEETENLIEEEKAALNELKVRANTLLQRIDDAISASKIADDIKLSDKAELEEAKEAIEAAIEEYERNYTETELSLLNTKLEIVNNALIAIGNSEKVIALIIALPEIIKESDKDIIDAAKTAYDSLTDDEKEMVGSEYVNRLNAALKAYDNLEEIKRISDAVKGYDLSNVKSTDLDALEQLIQDIDTLIVSNNLTDDKKTALSNIKTDVNNLIAMISVTVKLIETLTGITDGYILNEVKSTDRDAITKIIADIISLEETENLIEEKAALNELKVRANTLLQRIDDAISASKIADDIKLSDKAELEEAKEAIEAAIEEYERNYTETELSLLNTKLEIVNNALIAIGNSEKVIALIITLPEIIKESDKDIIDAAKTAYDSLTNDEKEMVGSEYVNRLNAALKAYDNLIISPQTNDMYNMVLWVVILIVSGSAIAILRIVKKSRKENIE